MKTVLIDMTALRTSRRTGGIGRHIRELASGLAAVALSERSDLRIVGLTCLDSKGGFHLTEDLKAAAESDPLSCGSSSELVTLWARRLTLFRAAMATHADLVHLPDSDSSPWIHAGAKIVLTCHDLAELSQIPGSSLVYRGLQSLKRRQSSSRYCSANHLIAISGCTAEDLRVKLGVESSRISVIYNGVDLARWSSQPEPDAQALLRSRWGLNNAKYAIYVGDARWRKNLRGMLQGLAQARCIAPHLNLQLVWAGALSSDHEKAIDEETRVLDLSNAVHRIGFVSDADLSLLYRDAVAHLFVSRYEGFGLTVVEAMASGCPVITTRRTSLAEVAGDAALDVDPDDYQGIGEALVRVSSDPSLRSDLQERGLRRAQRFSHVRQARETLDIYRRVL